MKDILLKIFGGAAGGVADKLTNVEFYEMDGNTPVWNLYYRFSNNKEYKIGVKFIKRRDNKYINIKTIIEVNPKWQSKFKKTRL